MASRCSTYFALLAFLSALLLAAQALAQARPSPIPENSKRGYIRHVAEMAVTMDDKAMQLAAGATIRNQRNLIIVPVNIPQEGAWADYVLDRDGQILHVWLLTPAELAQPKPLGG